MPWWWQRKKKPVPQNRETVEIRAIELPADVAQELAAFFKRVEQLQNSSGQLRRLVERHPDIADDDDVSARLQVAWERAIRELKPDNPFEFGFMDELYHRVTNTPGCGG